MPQNIDDFERMLEKILDKINYPQFQTRDGSHVTNNGMSESFQKKQEEINKSLEEYAKQLKEQNRTQKEIDELADKRLKEMIRDQEFSEKTDQEIIDEVEEYKQNLKKANKKHSEINQIIDDLRKKYEKAAKEDIEKQARKDAYTFVSGGKSLDLERKSNAISRFGAGLDNLSGGKGVVGKLGRGFTEFGGKIKDISGKLGIWIKVVDLLCNALSAVVETTNKLQEVENKKATIKNQRDIKLNTLAFQGGVDELQTEASKIQKELQLQSSLGIQQAQILTTEALAQLSTGIDSITTGINESAWNALNKKIDVETLREKRGIEEVYGTKKLANELGVIESEYAARQTERYFEAQKAFLQATKEMTDVQKEEFAIKKEHWAASMVSYEDEAGTGNSGKDYGKADGLYNINGAEARLAGALGTVGSVVGVGKLGDVADAQKWQQANVTRTLTTMENNLEATSALSKNINDLRVSNIKNTAEISNAVIDYQKNIKNITADFKKDVRHLYSQFSQTIETLSSQWQKTLYASANGKGITQALQLRQYNIAMQGMMSEIAKKNGVTAQEIIDIQNAYGEETGRALIGNKQDLDKASLVAKFTGDGTLPSSLANAAEIFNIGMSDTLELVNKMAMQANKMGLDGRKYMKDMVKNLQLAQKYNFKGGIQGMMKMAKWAQNVRYDLNNLPSLLEDMFSGGLEGAITKAAKLQVLGGRFAMGADPLAMMYESMEDPAALAERINDMTAGMGRFNSKTGQVEFNGMEQRQLQLLAEYTGQTLDSVKNQASYKMKKEKMGDVFGYNNGLDNDQKASLVNKAYFKNGEWMVNTLDGKEKKVSEINSNNISQVQADTHEGVIEQSLAHIVSSLDLLNGATESSKLALSKGITESGVLDEELAKRREAQQKEFSEQFDYYKETITQNMSEATQAYIENLGKNASSIEDVVVSALGDIGKNLDTFQNKYDQISAKVVAYMKQNGFVDTDEWKRSAGGDVGKSERTVAIGKNKNIYQNYSVDKLAKDGIIIGYNQDGTYKFDNDKFAARFGSNNKVFSKWISATDKQYNKNTDDYKSEYGDDFTTSGNGTPMVTSASKVTSINDGSIVQSDPQDHAIFAKTGGPFDTLFNGIFAKINEISSVLPRAMEYIMPLAGMTQGFTSNYKDTANNGNIKIETVKIELSGSLELTSNGGQSINIIDEIRNNPVLLRSLTQLISEGINKNINGGKSTYTGGLASPRFNTIGY